MRMSGIAIGQYYASESFLHEIDPRAKIVAAFVYAVALFFVGAAGMAVMAAGLLLAVMLAGIPPGWLLRSIRPVLILIAITFLFQLLLSGGEEPFALGPLTLYKDGARHGAFLAARLVLLVMSSALLTFTTAPVRLTDGFSRLISPLNRVRVPAYELSLMMSIALRFIPTLLAETDRIMKAQAARGARPGRGGIVRRARSLLPVLVPLFVISFRHADELALAMESRCYRGGRGRTVRRQLRFVRRDAVFAAAVMAILAVSLAVSYW